ncbi:uncharacterized protein LOC110974236 [Acanthaster planci]|uniref:Uncharacterized protein LOC110974236 n=1 Tax=Acanthaster planci TaxID=133434 RepID=A0A8B7XKU2_ACAPL|nr:uncharacterized protein LOC110974236 [Acanthaster planci]XP_022081423.1 uncharacterized protein LOC110974236 [Acanthaster planci]
MSNALRLTRALPLNDAGGTQLFTFLLSMNDLESFFDKPTKSSPIYYEGHEWYLTCGGYQSKESDDIYLGMYLYWDNKAAGEGVSCRADYRLIVRNVRDASESVVSEGSQVEFSAPDTLGWGKRELAPLHEVLAPGNGFLVDPGRTVIVELAVRYCRTIYQQLVDFSQLPEHMNQPFSSYFTPNFSLCGFDFYMSFYPLGDREEAERHVSMYLHRFNNPHIPECLCCRIRYRFFLGDLVSPTGDSKTFEFSFRSDRGYGRFKAFEPLANMDMFRKGLVPLGVEILSIIPFAFVEVPLATRGYYHTDNFVFDDVIFPDHRMNVWKLSANNSSKYLSLRLDTEDRNKIFPVGSRGTGRDALCTKYLQWKAYLLSRTDRSYNVSISEVPISAYFSPAFPEKLFSMATKVPIQRAKALDGDYCTTEEPSLLFRIEFFNVQDIPGVLQDYPVLEFERFRLYQTREGLRRCLDVNSSLRNQLDELRKRLNEVMNISESNIGGSSKQQLIREFRSLLQASDETDSSSQAAYKSMISTPGSDTFATAFSFSGTPSLETPAAGRVSPYVTSGTRREPLNKVSQLFGSHPGNDLPDFGSAPPATTAVAMPSATKGKVASLGAALRTSKGGSSSFFRGTQARASTASTSSVRFSKSNSKPTLGSSASQSALKEGQHKQSSGVAPAQKSMSSLDRQQVVSKHFFISGGNAPATQPTGPGAVKTMPEQTIYASLSVPSKTVPTITSPASNTFAIVSKPAAKYDSEPGEEYETSTEGRKQKFNPNIFKAVLPKWGSSGASDQSSGKATTLPRSVHPGERVTDFYGNKSLERPAPGIFNQPSRSTSNLSATRHPTPAVQKVNPTPSPNSTLTRSGGVTSLNNPGNYSNPPTTISTAIVMPVQDVTYTEPNRIRKPPVPAPRKGLLKNPSDDGKGDDNYFDGSQATDVYTKETSQYPEKSKLDYALSANQTPSEEKAGFSRASVASIEDPMLQTEVYSIFAQAARDGVKLVEEPPEMHEPLVTAAPEPSAKPQGGPELTTKSTSRTVPAITVTDPACASSVVPRHGAVGGQPLSPSILKKGDSFSSSQGPTVRKSRSANNVRFSEDNVSVTSQSSSVEMPGQAQPGTNQGDLQLPTPNKPTPSFDQYDGHNGQYPNGGQSARQMGQQQQKYSQQQNYEQKFQEQQYRTQLQKQQVQLQQQQRQRQKQQLPEQQYQRQGQEYNQPHRLTESKRTQQVPVAAEEKQQYRLEQLRREHQEYVNQLLQQQQQPSISQQQHLLQHRSGPRSEANLSRTKSASSEVVQTSL